MVVVEAVVVVVVSWTRMRIVVVEECWRVVDWVAAEVVVVVVVVVTVVVDIEAACLASYPRIQASFVDLIFLNLHNSFD